MVVQYITMCRGKKRYGKKIPAGKYSLYSNLYGSVTGANPVVTLYLLSLCAFVILEDIRPIVLFCSSRTHPRCNMQYIHMMHVQCCL